MVNPKDTLRYKKRVSNSGWHSRGYLPHFDSGTDPQVLHFRLFDSVPQSVIEHWRLLLAKSRNPDAEIRKRVEKYSDAGYGACFLRNPSVASMMQNSLLHFDGIRYRLHAWVVMPNHVHCLLTPREGYKLKQIMHSIKGYSSSEANRILGRGGAFWMEDYFDRWIRSQRHFNSEVKYIEDNPVKAGLCKTPEEWPWSSARWKAECLDDESLTLELEQSERS